MRALSLFVEKGGGGRGEHRPPSSFLLPSFLRRGPFLARGRGEERSPSSFVPGAGGGRLDRSLQHLRRPGRAGQGRGRRYGIRQRIWGERVGNGNEFSK